ncbi:MAG: hypothetical protein QOK37_1048 [Thermoanaerobaculia bacterium]|jgi:hypothetical protein|nr:hypothetical protein [Thermoanaerobaculia bacterium]
MSRRAEHHNLANGLLTTFVSRNNDVNGYWAIGRLRSEAERSNTPVVELDILEGTSAPDTADGRSVASFYREWVRPRLAKLREPAGVASVLVRLNFAPEAPLRFSREISTFGAPFTCEVLITSSSGATRVDRHTGRCAPHDPKNEHRSTRAAAPAPPWYKQLFK